MKNGGWHNVLGSYVVCLLGTVLKGHFNICRSNYVATMAFSKGSMYAFTILEWKKKKKRHKLKMIKLFKAKSKSKDHYKRKNWLNILILILIIKSTVKYQAKNENLKRCLQAPFECWD